MAVITVYPERIHYCAFCTHWFDPGCSAIKPVPYTNGWRCDCSIRNVCTKKNIRTYANSFCSNYVAKVQL